MRPRIAIVLAASLLSACASDAEPGSSTTASTTTAPTSTTAAAAAGETFDFCSAGEVYLRNYEDFDYARPFEPAELQAFMERGNAVTDTMGAEAPAEIELSVKAVAAAFDKRRTLYGNHDYVIATVTPEENAVLAAVEVDVEDSEQRVHDDLVRRCNIAL